VAFILYCWVLDIKSHIAILQSSTHSKNYFTLGLDFFTVSQANYFWGKLPRLLFFNNQYCSAFQFTNCQKSWIWSRLALIPINLNTKSIIRFNFWKLEYLSSNLDIWFSVLVITVLTTISSFWCISNFGQWSLDIESHFGPFHQI